MTASSGGYAFRPIDDADLDMLARWLAEPHVRRWWGDPDEQFALVSGDRFEPTMRLNIVSYDGAPFGYIQSYQPHAYGVLLDQPDGVRGIDLFIGDPGMTRLGHGPGLIAAYCEALFAGGAPRVVTDPDPDNAVAIRAYEKAGFQPVRHMETQDGPAVLMARDRAEGHLR